MTLFDAIHTEITHMLSFPVVVVALMVLAVFLLFLRPKIFIILVLVALSFAGVVAIFDKLSDLGLDNQPLPGIERQVNSPPCDATHPDDC